MQTFVLVLHISVLQWVHFLCVSAQAGPDESTCLDLMLVFDASCSVDIEQQKRAIVFSKQLIESLTIDDDQNGVSVRVGAALFRGKVTHGFYLNKATEDVDQILEELEKINDDLDALLEDKQCQTKTQNVLRSLKNEYFNADTGNRSFIIQTSSGNFEKYPDVVVMFTDARTSPRKYANPGGPVESLVKKLLANGAPIYAVLLPNNRIKGGIPKPPADKDLLTNNEGSRIYDIRKDGSEVTEAVKLAEVLNREHFCRIEASLGCADIVFAFDVSCSIDSSDAELSRFVASEVYRKVTESGLYAASAVVFDKKPDVVFSLDTYGNEAPNYNTVLQRIQTLSINNKFCRTITPDLFKTVGKITGGTDLAPNFLLLFYDGLTAPNKFSEDTVNAARKLIDESNYEIMIIRINNNRDKTEKDGAKEFEAIDMLGTRTQLFPQDETHGMFLNADNSLTIIDSITAILSGGQCEITLP